MKIGCRAVLASCLCAALALASSPRGQAPDAKTPGPNELDKDPAVVRPCDLVQLADGTSLEIAPVAADTLLDPQFAGQVTVEEYREDDTPAIKKTIKAADLVRYVPHERRVLEAVAAYEKTSSDVPPAVRWTAVETALASALRFHLAQRDRPLQGTNRWAELQTEIENQLREARRRLLRAMVSSANRLEEWTEAIRFGDRVALNYGSDRSMLDEVARLRTRFAGWTLLQLNDSKMSGRNYALVRQQLDWLEEHYLQPPAPEPLTLVGDGLLQAGRPLLLVYRPEAKALVQLLKDKAAVLFAAAKAAPKDDKKALHQLEDAMLLWPRLPGLYDELLKRKGAYAILNVGVRQLPEFMAPPLACTAIELQVVELLFESLLQCRPGEKGRLTYVAQLAGNPAMSGDMVRSFVLAPQARWSDGARVLPADVQRTFQMLTNPGLPALPARVAELGDQVELLRTEDDLLRVDFRQRKGLLDPAAPFAFKVLPHRLETDAAALEKFARAPVGSGPFVYQGMVKEHGRTYVVFKANPLYYGRPGRPLPQIREVRLFVCKNPAADFADKTAPMHLMLDLPEADVSAVITAGVKDVRTLQPRRVYFIAVNSADRLLADADLRRALAHGIDRKRLLDEHFRGGKRLPLGPAGLLPAGSLAHMAMVQPISKDHQPLNGPFPSGSWAVCTDGRVPPPGEMYSPVRARKFLADAKQQAVRLQLKYPKDDARVAAVCKAMAEQWAELGEGAGCPITVELVPLTPVQLRADLLSGDYQLAYWHHDYPNDTYSLWPLLDPREDDRKKVANYLGYGNDGTLTSLLVKTASYCEFGEVKKLTHDLHDHVYRTMPLIPLWQLDMHLAFHPSLAAPEVDPLRVFSNIEEWKLLKR